MTVEDYAEILNFLVVCSEKDFKKLQKFVEELKEKDVDKL